MPTSSVALFPNDQDNLKVLIHPPKTAKTKAASKSCSVKVTSRDNPEAVAVAKLVINLEALPELEVAILPQSDVGRKGYYQISVSNPINSEVKIKLSASDAQRRLWYHLHPKSLTIPPAGQSEAILEVRFGWLDYLKFGEKRVNFQVVTLHPATDQSKTLIGELIGVPWYKPLTKIRLPHIRLPHITLPWLKRPPSIKSFTAITDDNREYKIGWSVQKADEIKLDDVVVESQGEVTISLREPTEYTITATNKYGTRSKTLEIIPRRAPKVEVSEHLSATLSPTHIQAQAGGVPIQALLKVQNTGEIVDKYLIEVEGLDESWYSRSTSSIALMPQTEEQLQLLFQPPKKRGVKAKIYPFAIVLRSQSRPEDVTSITGQLEVLPSVEFKIAVLPFRITSQKKGKYRVAIENIGVSDASLELEATDLDEGLQFRFKKQNVVVAAWTKTEVPMVVKPKRGSTVGERKRYDITVTGIDSDGKTQTANAELHHRPTMGSYRTIFRILKIVIYVAVIVGLVILLKYWGGGWPWEVGIGLWFDNIWEALKDFLPWMEP
jgi:hypothetical protein